MRRRGLAPTYFPPSRAERMQTQRLAGSGWQARAARTNPPLPLPAAGSATQKPSTSRSSWTPPTHLTAISQPAALRTSTVTAHRAAHFLAASSPPTFTLATQKLLPAMAAIVELTGLLPSPRTDSTRGDEAELAMVRSTSHSRGPWRGGGARRACGLACHPNACPGLWPRTSRLASRSPNAPLLRPVKLSRVALLHASPLAPPLRRVRTSTWRSYGARSSRI